MKLRDLMYSLYSLEKSHDVFDMSVQNAPIWEYLRPYVAGSVINSFCDAESKIDPDQTNSTIANLFSLMKNAANPSRNPFFSDTVDILFVGKGRRQLLDGKYTDIILDPVVSKLSFCGFSFAFLEPPIWSTPGLHFSDPIATPSQDYYYSDILHLSRHFTDPISNTRGLPAEESTWLLDMASDIDDTFETNVSDWIVDRSATTLHTRKHMMGMYTRLLNRINPSVIVMVDYSSKRPIVESAASLDISTVEIQHGVINDLHAAYQYSNRSAITTSPDHLFVWGSGWTDNISVPSDVHVVGNPHLEHRLSQSDWSQMEERDEIVVLSQWTFGKMLAEFAIDLADIVAGSETTVVFKPHPKVGDDWVRYYPELSQSDVTVNTGDLYRLLATSNAVVGVSSTSLFEAMLFDVQLFVLNAFTSDYLAPLVRDGHAQYVQNPQDVFTHYTTGHSTDTVASSEYFSLPAADRIVEKLSELA